MVSAIWASRRLACRLLAAGLFAVSGAALGAGNHSPTLDKIRDYGAIYLGYRESAPPFSYLDAQGRAVGFALDLCAPVLAAIKQRLGRPDLAVVPIPVTEGSRQMLVEAGTVDLECGMTNHTLQADRFVGFSVTLFAAAVKALVHKDAGIATLADMNGKTVVTTAGALTDGYVRAAASRSGLSLNYRFGRDNDDSLRQLLRGEGDALVLDDVLLRGLVLALPDKGADRLRLLDTSFAVEPYALVFRRNDPEFKKLVDDTLIGLMKSGEFSRLYDRWFTSPINPDGKNFALPMSDLLKQLIRTPNDKGI